MTPSPRADETLDCILLGKIQLLQGRHGYRTAIDAPLLAQFSAEQRPDAATALDLGAGTGLVAILLARALRGLRVHLLETQPALLDRARRNAQLNGVADRLTVVAGDVVTPPPLPCPFDLITCNPPYLPGRQGHFPRDPERRIAHQETSANLRQFCQAAAAAMDVTSVSCWVFPHHDRARLFTALRDAQLADLAVADVRHRPRDSSARRVLVSARRGRERIVQLPDRAIHPQDQVDSVFDAEFTAFLQRL